jgi:hypothetical protein
LFLRYILPVSEALQHPRLILEVLVAYWAFSALVSGMPKPKEDNSQFWYGWLYTSLHTFAGSLAQAAKNPSIQKVINIEQEKTP